MNSSPQAAPLSGVDLTLAYDARTISEGLSIEVPRGKITVIIGPNACGKSTLLRALSRLLTPESGQVLLDGRDVQREPAKAFARAVGLLPQSSTAPFGIVVSDLVARGRFPHQRLLRQWSEADEVAVRHALEATGLTELADRPVEELSGGQRQRVWIALLLAQDPPVMLLDEPTTYLDIAHQVDVLDLCRRLNRDDGRTLVLVLHDLALAARYADHLVVMSEGSIVAEGPAADVLTEPLLDDVFRLRARVIEDPVFGGPLVVPIESVARGEPARGGLAAADGTPAVPEDER